MININDKINQSFSKAEKLFSEGKLSESIDCYKNILNENPNFLPALNNLALAYEYSNDLVSAEKYYFKCYLLNSKEVTFINNLSNLYLKQGKFTKAEPLLRESLNANQNQINIIRNMIMCLIDLNKRSEAEKEAEKYLKIFERDKILNKIHGRNLIKLNKHKKGLDFLKKGTGFIELNLDDQISILN